MYAHRVLPFPDEVRVHRIYRSTMNHLTLLAGCYEIGSAGWDIWLYNHSSKSGFILIRLLVSWVSAFVAIFGAIFYADSGSSASPASAGCSSWPKRRSSTADQPTTGSRLDCRRQTQPARGTDDRHDQQRR